MAASRSPRLARSRPTHKSTIGTSRLDPGYLKRKEEALRRGYLWGSYHWGVTGNPEKMDIPRSPRSNWLIHIPNCR